MREPEKRRHSKSSAPSGPADSDESPKAAKRDGKPATERHIPATQDPEAPSDPTDNGRSRKRRLQDPLPLEEAPRRDGRFSSHHQQHHQQQQQPSIIVSENDAAAPAAPVNPTYVPRSGYYFQHDDRTGPALGRRNHRRDSERDSRREPPPKARYDDRSRDDYRGRRNDRHFESLQAGIRPKAAADDTWSHDKFLESQAEDLEKKKQPVERTRSSGRREFRETPPLRAEITEEGKGSEPEKRSEKRHFSDHDRRPEKGLPDGNLAQRERDHYRERGPDVERGRWMDSDPLRNRYNPRRSFNRNSGDVDRAGGRFEAARRNAGGSVVAADRWSHDMYEELNRSPTLKQEEDSVAQIEALLAM